MVSIVLYSVLLVGVLTGTIASPQGKIVGGSTAEVGQYPHQVSLRLVTHFCGGSIIGTNWILTSAHCLDGHDMYIATVVVGTNQLNAGGDKYLVANAIMNEYYNPHSTANDIGLIKTSETIITSSTVKIINLATSLPEDGTVCNVTGWGYTSYPSDVLPNDLQQIQLYKISLKECSENLPNNIIHDTNVCAFKAQGEGICGLDFGGALTSRSVQFGIVSWGIPCAVGVPDVFTSVPSYRSWIKTKTGI